MEKLKDQKKSTGIGEEPWEAPAIPALLLEESAEVASRLIPIFKKYGYNLRWVENAADALLSFSYLPEGLIVLGESDSWQRQELCREFRKLEKGYTYVIMMGDASNEEERDLAYSDGVDEFLHELLNSETIARRLQAARRLLSISTDMSQLRAHWEQTSEQARGMNQALTVATQRFGELFNGLPVACFTFGRNGEIQDWNRAAEDQFGIAGYLAYQQRIQDVLQANEDVWSDEQISEIFREQKTTHFDWSLTLGEGVTRYFACSLFLQRSHDGTVQGVISANLDITERILAREKIERIASQLEQKQSELLIANRRLAEMAKTDTLTGLANRRAFEDLLSMELEETNSPFSLVMLDVDHFKSFNDTYGHQVGDDVLREVAAAIREVCRDEETACRYGGEEFVVLLPHTDEARSVARAEAFRSAVESAAWTHRSVTISLGVATRAGTSEGLVEVGPSVGIELIHRADEALYASKESGRNRVTHASAARLYQPDDGFFMGQAI